MIEPECGAHAVFIMAGIYMAFLTCFGVYLACKTKRPMVFKIKLVVVYLIPFMLAVVYLFPGYHVSEAYRILLFCTFITLTQMLYWREPKKLTTSLGYHRKTLVDFLDLVPDMVWMKDVDNRFTYTNEAIRTGLLLCTETEAYGKTGVELAEIQRGKGHVYTFGEVCGDSDDVTISKDKPCRFLEFGKVNGKFLALQVFKAPLYITCPKGGSKMVGTIGMGRDLTYDFIDHEKIAKLLEDGDYEGAKKAFSVHQRRYMFTGNGLLRGEEGCG